MQPTRPRRILPRARLAFLGALALACAAAPPIPTPDAGDDTPDAGATPVGDPGPGELEFQLFGWPDNTPDGAVLYVTGTFNDWNPADPAFQLRPDGSGAFVTRVGGLSPGASIEFKFTRGAFSTVEKAESGAELPNRTVTFDPAYPRVAAFVAKWADQGFPRRSRTGRVSVLTSVDLPQLSTTRNVWVYLPPTWPGGPERFPVAYAFDAQNLFDRSTAAFGREWMVDETLERLVRERRIDPFIVVGVENSEARPCEYNVFANDPHPGCSSGSALGDQTIAFLVDTLKPRIDRDYPTRPEREHTIVFGSSMGGSMALRAGLSRPDVFSRVGAFSPSYQNQPSNPFNMPTYVRARGLQAIRVHQDMGLAERIRDLPSETLVANARAVDEALGEVGVPAEEHRFLTIPGAVHNEDAWAARFGEAVQWLWR